MKNRNRDTTGEGNGDIDAGSRSRYSDDAYGRIRDDLRKTEEVIRALKAELDHQRTQSEQLGREREKIPGLLGRLESGEREITGLKGEIRLIQNDRERLNQEIALLKKDNERLTERNAQLEAALSEEKRQREQSHQVIVYLEAQIQQLESMLEMLRDHASFKNNE